LYKKESVLARSQKRILSYVDSTTVQVEFLGWPQVQIEYCALNSLDMHVICRYMQKYRTQYQGGLHYLGLLVVHCSR